MPLGYPTAPIFPLWVLPRFFPVLQEGSWKRKLNLSARLDIMAIIPVFLYLAAPRWTIHSKSYKMCWQMAVQIRYLPQVLWQMYCYQPVAWISEKQIWIL